MCVMSEFVKQLRFHLVDKSECKPAFHPRQLQTAIVTQNFVTIPLNSLDQHCAINHLFTLNARIFTEVY